MRRKVKRRYRDPTRFKCIICGKVTTGRMPRENGRRHGDGSERFPRRHNGTDGKPCPGNVLEAEWIDTSK